MFLAHSLSPWVAWTNWTGHWPGVTDPNRCGPPADTRGGFLKAACTKFKLLECYATDMPPFNEQ
ncbi:hypothetical protein D8I24_0454 [Cupriavidus necator H850]|nr:hypothetical protein D8I24_0454 [Cupriavidus necator H850]